MSNDTTANTVKACPECDQAQIRYLTQKNGLTDHDSKFECRRCGHRFDEPREREPKSRRPTPVEKLQRSFGISREEAIKLVDGA